MPTDTEGKDTIQVDKSCLQSKTEAANLKLIVSLEQSFWVCFHFTNQIHIGK